jgi:transcriptional regulator with XRE-family HTH domain
MIREKIRKTIYERGLKIEKIAEATGLNQANIYAYLKGSRNFNLKQLDKLMHHLGLFLMPKEGFVFDAENVPKFRRK